MKMSSPRPAFDLYRLVILVLLLGGLFATTNWLQGRFDESDHTKSLQLVRNYRVGDGPSIEDVIAKNHSTTSSQQITWSTEIVSGCRGHVRVVATISERGKRSDYAFDVNMNGPSIHPTDPETVKLLKALSEPVHTSTAS